MIRNTRYYLSARDTHATPQGDRKERNKRREAGCKSARGGQRWCATSKPHTPHDDTGDASPSATTRRLAQHDTAE